MKYFNLLFLSSLILLAASCRKSDYKAAQPVVVTVPTPTTEKQSLNQLFSPLRSVPSGFSVPAGTYRIVRGPQGTKFTFYPNSFKDKNGNIITSGTIHLQLTEMYRPGAMIANRATTVSNGSMLKSSGQIYVTATMNGSEVFVNKYGLGFITAQPSFQTMSLFYGNTNNADSLTTWPIANYGMGMTTSATVIDTMLLFIVDTSGTVIDTTAIYRHYNQFDSTTSLSWVNCDSYYDSTVQHTNISVNPTDTSFNNINTEIFIAFPGINGVTAVSKYDAATHTFSLPAGSEIPTGMTVSIVAIANKGGNFFYYQQNGITLTPGMTFNPVMTPRTVSYITGALSVL